MIGAGVVVGDYRPAFHRVGDEALIDYALRHLHFGACGGGVNIAARYFPLEAHVVGRVVVDLRRSVLGGGFGVHGGGQHVVVHFYQRSGVGGYGRIIGHYGGYGVAHAAHLAYGERRMRHLNGVRHHPAARQRTQLLRQILAGVHRLDAVHGGSGGCVYGGNVGVGVGAANKRDVQHSHQFDVIYIGSPARYEARVFAALDARAENGRRCGCGGHSIPLLAEIRVRGATMLILFGRTLYQEGQYGKSSARRRQPSGNRAERRERAGNIAGDSGG